MMPARPLTAIAVAAAALLIGCSRETDDSDRSIVASSAVRLPTPKPSATAPQTLSCDWPIKDGDTAKTVIERFGPAAVRDELDGPEGTTIPGLVLWGDDAGRRIEVLFDEEAPADRIAGWRIAEGSDWIFAGLAIGDPLARVVAVNGSPFRFYGFAWDYGGYVTDWRGGALDRPDGGCGLSVRLSPNSEELPNAMMGEGELSSDAAVVLDVGARVSEISVGFGRED